MQNPKPPNILVADDHAMMRDGIVLMIQAAWPDSRCEIADDFQSVMAKIDASNDAERFNAIVLDLRMPVCVGPTVCRKSLNVLLVCP
ncbi:MAG: response regulator [Rhodoferax sp.]|nr:response regulator [Rhodoferax sp.]